MRDFNMLCNISSKFIVFGLIYISLPLIVSLKESNVPRKQQLPYTINWNDFNAFFSYKKVAKLPLNYIFNTKGSFFYVMCSDKFLYKMNPVSFVFA